MIADLTSNTRTWGLLAAMGLNLIIFGGLVGGPTVAFVSEYLGFKRGVVFAEKFAQQASRLAHILAWGVFLALGVAVLLLKDSPYIQIALAVGLVYLLSLIFLVGYWAGWNILVKNKKPLHLILGIHAVTGFWALLLISMLILRLLAGKALGLAEMSILPPVTSTFWAMTVEAVFLCLTISGIINFSYLFARRKKDDFGRDYYRWAGCFAARWSLYPAVGAVAAGTWVFMQSREFIADRLMSHFILIPWALGMGLVVVNLVLMAWVSKSAHPMRLRFLAPLSLLILWAAMCMITMTYVQIHAPVVFLK